MKQFLLLFLPIFAVLPSAAQELQPASAFEAGDRSRRVRMTAPGPVTDPAAGIELEQTEPQDSLQNTTAAAKPRRNRFLPMRRRIDREIDKNKYAYKGEVIFGLTVSYGTISSDDTDYFLILDNFNADGSITTVNPFIGYFYRDNRCLGLRFGYRHISGRIGNLSVDLGEQNDIDLDNIIEGMDLSSNNLSFGLFHRSYVGLDPKGRFGLFAEMELAFSSGNSEFTYMSGDEPKTTYTDNFSVRLSFNPGVAVYIFPNVCGTLSFGLGGLQYASVTQKDANGVKTGSRDASKLRFRLNLADINFGMTIHLWDKKKK